MLSLLLASVSASDCASGNTSCLLCIGLSDCGYCWDEGKVGCVVANSTCQDLATTRTRKCVEQLGGDAKNSVRYGIGFSILAVAIAIDVAVRILASRGKADEYSHL